MSECIFLIEDAPEGRYTARALGESIFTEGDTLEVLRKKIRGAVACHYDDDQAPKILRLHFWR